MNADDLDSEEFSNKFSDYFEFRAELGKGAFGVVISALRKADNKEYAVKVIQKQNVSSADWDRLRQEAFILSDLNHPNIVRFKDIIETERRIFLVMELVQGGQLRHLIEARRRNHIKFTDDEASTIMKSILKAVQYLHTKEVVHRDLKPENILVQDWKNLNSIKIADFGLSAQFTEDTFMRSFRQKCGTMIYMAPEQALEQQYSKPVDIWSCGLIMYILLAGKHPLYQKTDTPIQYVEKLKNPIWVFGDYFTPLAQNFFLKLMHTDSVVRYTAEDALKHPWITRRFNDQIPLSAHEVMTSFSVEQSFSRIMKAMYLTSCLAYGQENHTKKNLNTEVSEDYKALVERLSEEHQKPLTHKKPLHKSSIMLQYDSLQSLLGLVSPHNKESPMHSQFAKKKETPVSADDQEKNSPVAEENKDMIRKISLFEEKVETEIDNLAVFGAAKDTITLPKIIKDRESPKINIYTPGVGERPSYINILDSPTNPHLEEIVDAQTTQETVPSISAEHKLAGLTLDTKANEIYEGMKSFLHAGISRSTRDSAKQNFSLQFSYEDQGFDSDAPASTNKLSSPNVASRKRAPSVNQIANHRAESSNNTSYASEDSSESTSSADPQKPPKDEIPKAHKKSPFFHSAQKPSSSGKNSQMGGDKTYPFSLIKSPTNNVSTPSKSKTKDFTLPQIVATSTPKGSGTSRSKDKSFTFKSPERINKATLNPHTPSAHSTRLPLDVPEPKLHSKNFSMPQKNFRSSNDLLSLANLNVKDISHTSQSRRLSTLKDDPKNQNTFL